MEEPRGPMLFNLISLPYIRPKTRRRLSLAFAFVLGMLFAFALADYAAGGRSALQWWEQLFLAVLIFGRRW